jgi:hypothetical protein
MNLHEIWGEASLGPPFFDATRIFEFLKNLRNFFFQKSSEIFPPTFLFLFFLPFLLFAQNIKKSFSANSEKKKNFRLTKVISRTAKIFSFFKPTNIPVHSSIAPWYDLDSCHGMP